MPRIEGLTVWTLKSEVPKNSEIPKHLGFKQNKKSSVWMISTIKSFGQCDCLKNKFLVYIFSITWILHKRWSSKKGEQNKKVAPKKKQIIGMPVIMLLACVGPSCASETEVGWKLLGCLAHMIQLWKHHSFVLISCVMLAIGMPDSLPAFGCPYCPIRLPESAWHLPVSAARLSSNSLQPDQFVSVTQKQNRVVQFRIQMYETMSCGKL